MTTRNDRRVQRVRKINHRLKMYDRYGCIRICDDGRIYNKFNSQRGRLSNDSRLYVFKMRRYTPDKLEPAAAEQRKLDSMNYRLEDYYRYENVSEY